MTMRVLLVALVSSAVSTGSVTAQAVCSAPHSSPTLAQGGAIGTLPPRAGWAQLSLLAQRSIEFFNANGDRQRFLAEGEFTTRSVFLTAAVGLIEGVELWAQLPAHRLDVDASSGRSESTGFGDVRIATRIGAGVLGRDMPIALRAGVKLPGSRFPVDATVLPLTEGQRDWEGSLEAGRSFDALPIYTVGWAGYRVRERNDRSERKPGNELFAHLAVGGTLRGWNLEVALDGLRGAAARDQGLTLRADERRLLQLLPTLGRRVGPGALDVTAQIPLAGRNLPAGLGASIGYRATWGLPDPELR